jgi:hypothetical protein
MRRGLISAAVTAVVAGGSFAFAAPASAATIEVGPGQSIQAAVNRAHPGDTIIVKPGVYAGSVKITKDDITLRGSGASKSGTVIVPKAGLKRCQHGVFGICIFGKPMGKGQFDRVSGTRVSGFMLKDFDAIGIVTFQATRVVIAHNVTVDTGEYGITSFESTHVRFAYNRAKGGGEAGFYFGDSPHGDAVIVGNIATGANQGFFFRDSGVGAALHNNAHGNCAGFVLLNTSGPGGVHDWLLRDNQVHNNDRFCKSEDGPPLSGIGIGIAGGRNNTIAHNDVWANRPAKDVPFAGGIVLVSSKPFGGSVESGNLIKGNIAYKNRPADIVWDGQGQRNRFVNNHCGRSIPNGLCH